MAQIPPLLQEVPGRHGDRGTMALPHDANRPRMLRVLVRQGSAGTSCAWAAGVQKIPLWAPNPNPPPASCSSRGRGHGRCLAAAESSWNHIESSRGGGEGESDLGLHVGKWEAEAGRAGADEK